MKDLSPVVHRGEKSGVLRRTDLASSPLFFTENLDHAKLYAGAGTKPIACVIQGRRVLDITQPDFNNTDHRDVVTALLDRFDDWTCRQSGEERDPWSYLEGGDLYDYEGTGSGQRWRAVFDIAFNLGFDAVRITDCTDGTSQQPSVVWCTKDINCVRDATLGEKLAHAIEFRPWKEVQSWLISEHGALLERINRLSCIDDEYRLDRVQDVVPAENFQKMDFKGGFTSIWRALPSDKDIRPGDWVALSREYASFHQKHVNEDASGKNQSTGIKEMTRVMPQDIYWAGTDEREFFYLPAAWRKEGFTPHEYLQSLTQEQIRILCDGEESLLTRHADAIKRVKTHVMESFYHTACGDYHGPDHWARVSQHGHTVSRACGVDPLTAHIFGWVHDSQREDEGLDPGHGPRAARFIQDNRDGFFGFLSDAQLELLARACELHSDGQTQGDTLVKACWDSDRLDLWRVDIEPNPRYMCTDHGKDKSVIQEAETYMSRDRESQLEDEFEETEGGEPIMFRG